MDSFEKDQTGDKNENYIILAIDVSKYGKENRCMSIEQINSIGLGIRHR